MKLRILTAVFAASAALLFSCRTPDVIPEGDKNESSEEKPFKAQIKFMDPQELIFSWSGGSQTVEIASNVLLKAKSEDSWCAFTLENQSGTRFYYTLTVTLGEDREGREGKIDIYPSILDINPEEPLGGSLEELTHTVTVTQLKADKVFSDLTGLRNVKITMAENPGLLSDITFTKNQGTMTYEAMYLKWIDADEPEKMILSFETDGEYVLAGGQKVISGETRVDVSKDFTMEVVAETGRKETYAFSLNCPQINGENAVIHLKPSSSPTSKETYVPTDIVLFDKSKGSTGTGWWDSSVQGSCEMRARGNSTWVLPKKPFRLKFAQKISPIGLDHANEKSWVLLAQDMDKSLLRNELAYEYSRILLNKGENYHNEGAILFTSSLRYVNVYWTGEYPGQGRKNGDFVGVYQFCDQMNRAAGRIDVEKLDSKSGEDKISGGYILESDIHEGNQVSSHGIKFTYKYPDDDDHTQTQYDYIKRFVNQAETALYGYNFTDPVNGWRKYFDEKTLADYIIVKELAQDMDGYTSTYCYKRRGIDKLFFGPVWDCDKGWDNDRRLPSNGLNKLMIEAGFRMPGASGGYDWFMRVWEDPEFRKFVLNRWNLKKTELEAATERILRDTPATMSKAIKANYTVWPFYYQASSEANMPAATYEKEIERIRNLTDQRVRTLDKLFGQ